MFHRSATKFCKSSRPRKQRRPPISKLPASRSKIPQLKVVVDPKTGCITSLYDKKAQFESIAAAPAATS